MGWFDHWDEDNTHTSSELDILREENKRLKEENERLKEVLEQYRRTESYYDAWGRDNAW